ncbi:hypothetical protein MKX01_007262 [Papaver californicum]|nr:hypothetical protein MKX01_007262 [Papaver californicum]
MCIWCFSFMMAGIGSPSSENEILRDDHSEEDVEMDVEYNFETSSGGYQGSTSISLDTNTLTEVIFDEHGRPVALGHAQFTTFIGKETRALTRPAIDPWQNVQKSMKEDIWKNIIIYI